MRAQRVGGEPRRDPGGDHDRGERAAGLHLPDGLGAARGGNRLHVAEHLARVAADFDALAAHVHGFPGRALIDDRHTRARGAAREREPDQQRDDRGVEHEQREREARAPQDQQVLCEQRAHASL